MATVSAYDVAAELRQRLPGVGTKKLHKLLYYCQGHHHVTFSSPLFTEAISAWAMGPVVGELWCREKQDGAVVAAPSVDEACLNTIGYVVSRYGALSGNDLEHLTHSEEPWREANARRSAAQPSVRIPPESIAAYLRRPDVDEEDQDALLPDADGVADWLRNATHRPGTGRLDSVEEIRTRLRVRA